MLKALIIENYQVYKLLMCGDFNARCGNLLDTGSEEWVPDRVVTDSTINTAGRELISCVRALDLLILNGRFNQCTDGFTSVSAHGLAVVNYCICPKICAESFSDFKVIDPMDVINTYNITGSSL